MSWVDRLGAGERRALTEAGRIGGDRFGVPLSDPVEQDPSKVIVDGQVWFLCTVCREYVARNRSGLDASGRCDSCRP